MLVKVVGPDGEPLEGVAVRCHYEVDDSWRMGNTTDLKGEVWVSVAVEMKGEFGVVDIRKPNGRPLRADNLKVPFEVKRGSGETFVIQLTEEQVGFLPKEEKE